MATLVPPFNNLHIEAPSDVAFDSKTYTDYLVNLATAVPVDISMVPFVSNVGNGVITVDMRLSNPYDHVTLAIPAGLTLFDDLGRQIKFDNQAYVTTIDGIFIPVIVTLQYIIFYDYNYLRISKRSTYDAYISCPVCPPASLSLPSLNGNVSEYKDGVQVSVFGRSIPYTVLRSYMSMMSTDTYTIVYDLVAADGSLTTCPESFLTLYVAPAVIQ